MTIRNNTKKNDVAKAFFIHPSLSPLPKGNGNIGVSNYYSQLQLTVINSNAESALAALETAYCIIVNVVKLRRSCILEGRFGSAQRPKARALSGAEVPPDILTKRHWYNNG